MRITALSRFGRSSARRCLLHACRGAAPSRQDLSRSAYYDFLIARHLEAQGDTKGAQAALEHAVAADPRSAEVRAEIAAFHLRRDAADDAGARRERSAFSSTTRTPRRIACSACSMRRAPKIQRPWPGRAGRRGGAGDGRRSRISSGVTDNPAGLTDLNLQYTLGRLYTRDWPDRQGDPGVDARRQREPAVGAGPPRARAGVRRRARHRRARSRRSRRSSTTSRASRTCSAQFQEQAGRLKDAADTYTKALSVAAQQPRAEVPAHCRAARREGLSSAPPSLPARRRRSIPTICGFRSCARTRCCEMGDAARAITVLEPVAKANSERRDHAVRARGPV